MNEKSRKNKTKKIEDDSVDARYWVKVAYRKNNNERRLKKERKNMKKR